MDYKIIFSDIDGTLLNQDRSLSKNTIAAVRQVKNKFPFVLISARMPAAMRHIQFDLDIEDQPIICYNGGLVLVNETTIHSTEIPIHIIESLDVFNHKINCHLSLYHNDEWYVPKFDHWAAREENNTKVSPKIMANTEVITKWKKEGKGAHKIMAMGPEAKIDEIRNFLTDRFPEELHLYRSKSTYLEIANKNVSKLTAIQLLLEEHFKNKIEETIAYGDNYNDVEMIKGVGMGVAVANARREVLEVANFITEAGTEDGVANSLKKIFSF